MNVLQSALHIVKESRRAFIILNAAYFGLIMLALIGTLLYPAPQERLYAQIGDALQTEPLLPIMNAYTEGRVLEATALTFGTNLIVGSLLEINLTSLILPFSGLLVAGFRAVLWGVLFAPNPAIMTITARGILGLIGLLFLEGEGYVLAMLAAYEQGRSFLWPRSAGAEGRWQGFKVGLTRMALVYVLVALVLLVAAIYEVALVALMPGA